MSFLELPLYISYNPYILNKDQNAAISTHHDEFVNVEVSATELSSYITSGYAYCAQMLGRRNKSNFLRSNIVFADVDEGMSLADALENDFVRTHATLISTTCSHTPEANKFRIGFVLRTTIEDPVRYAALARSVALRVCGDTRATDAARMFYGNTEADTQLFDAGIDHELAEELILQGLNLVGTREDSEARRALGQVSFRSDLKLRRDELIRTAQGQSATLHDIDAGASVHCPRHHDRNPSAFVVESSDKVTKGVHCRACAQTYWPEQPPLPDFDSFEAALREVKDYTVTHQDDGLFQNPHALPGVTAANIHFVEERFLTDLDPRPATTFVKSEKGTGKTELLKRISNAPGVNRVLFLGHRRTLVGSVCDRLDLVSYLQQHGETDPDRFGICLDSLPLVDERQRYDLVMIDESEQVIAHLLSSTLDAKRPRVLQSLARLLRMSKRVIVCDADLSWTSFLTISRMRQQGTLRPQDLQIIINTYRPAAGGLDVYASQNHLVEDFFRHVELGKRCYFTSNSRALIEKLAARLSTSLPSDAYITFTSVTSKEGSSRHKEFLRDPSTVAPDYQVVLASPTLSSGVDISITEPARQFDCVYGAFLPLVLTHFECDQQLARVRQPRSVKVYVSPARFNFETELGPVTEDLKKDQLMASFVQHVADDGKPEFMPTPMLEIAGLVRSAQRASMNELNKNFLDLKRRQGWTIRRIDNDPHRSALGREKLLVAQALADQQYTEGILASHVLTDHELQDIEKRIEWQEPVNLMERLSYDRTRLERFYGRRASPELLEIDSRGDLRRKIMLLEAVLDGIVRGDALDDDDHGVPGGALLDEQFRPVSATPPPVMEVGLMRNRRYQSRLLRDMLNAAGVCTDDGLNFTKEFAKVDLGELVEAAAVRSREFEAQFDRTLPPNLEKDPVSFLRSLMKLVGLNLKHTRTSRRRDGKTYHYTLADPHEVMRVVADRQLRAEFAGCRVGG